MSKIFVPENSPVEAAKKQFTADIKTSASQGADPFQMEWPAFDSEPPSFLLDSSIKTMQEKILRSTKEKALLIEKEAYDQGFAQGEKDGFELGQKRSETIFHQLQKIFNEMVHQQESLYRVYTEEMLQLVFCITRKILQQDLPLPEPVIHKTLQAAFHYVKEKRKVLLHVNPKDYEYLLARPELLPFTQENGDSGGVKMVVDPAISRGGCYLETSLGAIDATLETQLDQIASLIWEKVEKAGLLATRLPQ